MVPSFGAARISCVLLYNGSASALVSVTARAPRLSSRRTRALPEGALASLNTPCNTGGSSGGDAGHGELVNAAGTPNSFESSLYTRALVGGFEYRRSWSPSATAVLGSQLENEAADMFRFRTSKMTGTKAREKEIGILVEIQGGAPPIKGMPLGGRSL